VLGAASSSPGLPTLSSTNGLGSGGSGDRSSPHWRALFQPKSVRIALRVPLFSFGDFVMMELLRPLSPLTTLLVETGKWPAHATPLCFISHNKLTTRVALSQLRSTPCHGACVNNRLSYSVSDGLMSPSSCFRLGGVSDGVPV
jgi:hypothetical protein